MIFSENRFPLFGIILSVAVRVLAGGEPRQPLRRRPRLGRLARQAGELEEGRQPALDAVLVHRLYAGGPVQAADRHRDAVLDDVAEEQRRAAAAAEAALDELGAAEHAGLALGPGEVGKGHAGERREILTNAFWHMRQ